MARIITDEERKEFTARFNKFLKQYGRFYTKKELTYIKDDFLSENFEFGYDVDIVSQIYEYLGIFERFGSVYSANFELLCKLYDINTDILEVGCGYLPVFAKRIDEAQTTGSITAMDPDLIVTECGNIKLYKESFSVDTDVSKFKLLVGLSPCQATISLIESANKNDIDLYMMLCECMHFPEGSSESKSMTYGHYAGYEYRIWLDYLERRMKETLPNTRDYEFVDGEELDFPVIRTFKK